VYELRMLLCLFSSCYRTLQVDIQSSLHSATCCKSPSMLLATSLNRHLLYCVLLCAAAAPGTVVNVTCQAPEGGWFTAPNITLTGQSSVSCPASSASAVIPLNSPILGLRGGPSSQDAPVCPNDAYVTWNYSAIVNNVSSAGFSASDGVTCTPGSISIGEVLLRPTCVWDMLLCV